MKRSGIYIIKNITKCIYYVGEAEDIDSRKQQHFASLCNGSHVNKKMQEDYTNRDQFVFVICWLCPNNHELLLSEESRLIDKLLKSGKKLYNRPQYKYCMHYISCDNLKDHIVNDVCRGLFGKTFLEMTRGKSPAKYELLSQLIYNPEHKHKTIYNSFYQVADYYSTLRRKGVNYED